MRLAVCGVPRPLAGNKKSLLAPASKPAVSRVRVSFTMLRAYLDKKSMGT